MSRLASGPVRYSRRVFVQALTLSGGLWAAWAPISLARAGSYEDFFVAVKRNDPSTMQELAERGFDLNTPNPQGRHALHLALMEPALKVAEFLAKHPSVDVNALTPQDENPLMLAVIKGHVDLAKVLLDRDADVNKTGWAPLHYAASYSGPRAVEQVELLLEHHAYIDAESPNRTTPLMMAAQYGVQEVVALLLAEGADPLLTNELKLTALDFAVRGKRPSAIESISAAIKARRPVGKW